MCSRGARPRACSRWPAPTHDVIVDPAQPVLIVPGSPGRLSRIGGRERKPLRHSAERVDCQKLGRIGESFHGQFAPPPKDVVGQCRVPHPKSPVAAPKSPPDSAARGPGNRPWLAGMPVRPLQDAHSNTDRPMRLKSSCCTGERADFAGAGAGPRPTGCQGQKGEYHGSRVRKSRHESIIGARVGS